LTVRRREDTTDKVKANLKPDSQKSTLEKGQESVQGAADSVAGKLQPESEKSTTQQATDSGSNLMSQAGETLGNAVDTVKDSLGMGEQK